ncbi:PREDICTED: elongator complex protein 5, partial [Nanorana parkeri]|uniref:elongator complex protein 5 n=1 Tax=Nanorana parkeri TaxID=125878 RepID=UPI000854710C
LTLHDGFSDPRCWRSGSGSLTPQDFTAETIRDQLSRSASPVTVVLDSLSWILARCPLPSVCHTLRDLTRPQQDSLLLPLVGSHDVHFLSLLHVDVHDPGVVRCVRTVCDSVIDVTEGGERLGVTVTQRNRSGKVITSRENIRIFEDFSLETTTENQPESQRTEDLLLFCRIFSSSVGSSPLLWDLLLFCGIFSSSVGSSPLLWDLPLFCGISPSSVGSPPLLWDLPLFCGIFSSSVGSSPLLKSSLLQSSGSSGKIFYDPDPGDDLDEEDPDDDLDVCYRKSSLLQSSGSSGKIFYDPDPGDDLDEEDPDDDLDV